LATGVLLFGQFHFPAVKGREGEGE